MVQELPEKEIKKSREDLILLHKRCIFNWLLQKDIESPVRKQFFALYDQYITKSNIIDYFHLPLNVFIRALVRDELAEVKSFHRYTKKSDKLSKQGRKKQYV